MIKGKYKKVIITDEDILKKISPYDIYRYYQGPFKLNNVCVNVHRGEKDPSLIIGYKGSNDLTHKDFGDYSWRGNCFDFVKQIHRCDFNMALNIIDRDFNLGLKDQVNTKIKPSIITWEKPEIEFKRPPLIQIIYHPTMTKEALDYWAKLGQGEEDLKREKIYQPKEIWRNRKRTPIGKLLTFCYHYEDIDSWKIYRPFAPKKTDKTPMIEWKWDSNVPFNYIDNLKAINKDCPMAILAKSKKDRMVLMKALQTDCIADVQAEDASCLTDDTLDKLKQIDKRYVVSDNDKKGVEFSWWLTKEHNFKHVNVPYNIFDEKEKIVTDFAHLAEFKGIQAVTDYFKMKGII